jgi:restriction endonuclease fold toxin 7 of polymorphic toxin system
MRRDVRTGCGETLLKNVGKLSYTNQLRDFVSYAKENGYQFQLWVRETTQLSAPLKAEVENGTILLQTLKP